MAGRLAQTLYGIKYMNFLKQIISSLKCGGYEGRGHKHTRRGDFEKALDCYQKALEFLDNDHSQAGLLECISRTYARLGNYDQALLEAEKSYELFTGLESSATVIRESVHRLSSFIEALKNKDHRLIKEILTI